MTKLFQLVLSLPFLLSSALGFALAVPCSVWFPAQWKTATAKVPTSVNLLVVGLDAPRPKPRVFLIDFNREEICEKYPTIRWLPILTTEMDVAH